MDRGHHRHFHHNIQHHMTSCNGRSGSCKSGISHIRQDLVVEPIDHRWWGRLRDHQGSQHLESHYANSSAVFDADSDWFFLRLVPFHIKEVCDVEFLFEDFDTSNNNQDVLGTTFRQGVVWDFIELKQKVQIFNM